MRATLLLAALCACASPELRDTSADALWQGYGAALGTGGWDAVQTVIVVADYDYRGVNQTAHVEATSYWRRPGDYYQWMRGPSGLIERGVGDGRGWGHHPQTGLRRMDEQELMETRRDALFYQPYWFASDYESLTPAGRDTANGRIVDVLEGVVRLNGRRERLLFDTGTRLPVRLELWEGGPEAQREAGEYVQVRFDLSDYRRVNGLTLPHLIVRTRPNSMITYRIRSLRMNVPIPDSVFTRRN